MTKTRIIYLNLVTNEFAAREVAEATYLRANPHQSDLVQRRLDGTIKGDDPKVIEENAITVEKLIRYFTEISKAVAEFWESNYNPKVELTLKPHELRGLFLPLIYSVVFASVGNMQLGNYEYRIKARASERPDRKFLLEFSALLEANRDIIKGEIGQIGNRAAKPQSAVMLCVMSVADERTAEYLIRDGVNVDPALAGLATLVGLSLQEEAMSILYTGVQEANFRQLTDTLVDKNLMAIKMGKADPSTRETS